MTKFHFKKYKMLLWGILFTVGVVTVVVAAPPGSPFRPGETLAPTCAPGTTNCTARPANSGDGSVSVKDFGAKGDGITNDAAAIQAALDSLPNPTTGVRGGVIRFPAGVYNIGVTSLMVKAKSTRLLGQSSGGSIIKYSGSGAAIQGDGSETVLPRSEISYLQIETSGNGAKAIDFTYFSYSTFSHNTLIVRGNNASGFYGRGTFAGSSPYYNILSDNDIVMDGTTGSVGYYFDAYDPGGRTMKGPNANLITGGRISNGTTHVKIVDGNTNTFTGIKSESAHGKHIQVGSGIIVVRGTVASGSEIQKLNLDRTLETNRFVNGVVKIVSGKGAGQAKVVSSNQGNQLRLASHWRIIPDASSQFELYDVDAFVNVFRDWDVSGDPGSDFIRIEPTALGTNVYTPSVHSSGSGRLVSADVWRVHDSIFPGTYGQMKAFSFSMNSVPAGLSASESLNVSQAADIPPGLSPAAPLDPTTAGALGTEITIPYDFDIVGISIASTLARQAGSLVVRPTVQGASRSLSASFDGGLIRDDVQMIPLGKEPAGGAGQRLGVKITTDANFKPTTMSIVVTVFIVPK
ncbi:MAG: glycosyl hydrolase family 28-related protein [Candidatus Azambacteria bacterium]|nr:glycosyl hydrolase family 28-related protein [Candidatus Azambacteria bacterium]